MRRFFANAQKDRPHRLPEGASFSPEGTPRFIIHVKTKKGLDPR